MSDKEEAKHDVDYADPEEDSKLGVYPKGTPPRHPMDRGAGLPKADEDLRRAVHWLLARDLERIGVSGAQTLDFSRARAGRRWVSVHGGEVSEMSGVRVLGPGDEELYLGDVDVLRDKLADEFRCWWKGPERLPESIRLELDMGVLRRLARDPHFAEPEQPAP